MLCGPNRYYPSYIQRFTKVGCLLRMWFDPLQRLVGNLVEIQPEQEYDSEVSDDNKSSRTFIVHRNHSGIQPELYTGIRLLQYQNNTPVAASESSSVLPINVQEAFRIKDHAEIQFQNE